MMQRIWMLPVPSALLLTLAAIFLSSCASTPKGFTSLPTADTPRFDALAFFEGRSEGRGELSKVFSKSVPVRVQSEGVIESDGSLTLIQRIEQGDKDPRTRSWSIREVAPGRYAGMLTDATGPIEGIGQGNRLTLSYRMEDGFRVRQVLTLAPDGQSASNRLKVSLLGVTVAVLAEDIVRVE